MNVTINDKQRLVLVESKENPIQLKNYKFSSYCFRIKPKRYPLLKDLIVNKNKKTALLQRRCDDDIIEYLCNAILTGKDYKVKFI